MEREAFVISLSRDYLISTRVLNAAISLYGMHSILKTALRDTLVKGLYAGYENIKDDHATSK